MNFIYSLIAAIITAIIGYLLSMKKYKGYYHGFETIMKAMERATNELGWKEEYELVETITDMLEDNKVSNKEVKRVADESEDIYQGIMDLYEKYYGDE